MKLSSLAKALIASSMLFTATHATAAEPVTVTGSAAFTSDYLFRGVSQTSNNAAVQAAMTFTHESGAYFSMWGSSIASGMGGSEVDTLLGYSGKAGEVAYDVGFMRYNYPGLNENGGYVDAKTGKPVDTDYNEIYASISTMGAKVGFNYSPDYFAESDKFMYLYASYGTEVAGVGLSASLGMNKFDNKDRMNQALGLTNNMDDSYMDYKVAASKAVNGVTLEGAYIGSDIDSKYCLNLNGTENGLCEGRFVLTATKGF
jgi:uncharacterized protein (TIGR02001 family)